LDGRNGAILLFRQPGSARKLDELVREHILAAVAAAGGNKTKAAELLGIDRSTLCARLKEYGQG